jgi:hypothetical protein
MPDEAKRLPGRLVVVVKRTRRSQAGLFARFGSYGLTLPRLLSGTHVISTDGPHLALSCVSAVFFINAIYRVRKTCLEYDFSMDCLGHVNFLSGYVATDLGTESLRVTKLSRRADISRQETHLRLVGRCGPGLPWSFKDRQPPDGQSRFEAGFPVSDASLSDFFEQAAHVEMFKRNRDSCLFGASCPLSATPAPRARRLRASRPTV